MSANVESMFYNRETPWHKLGTRVENSLSSQEALSAAGLDWIVTGEPIYSSSAVIDGYKANTRSSDGKVLGIVSDRYSVVQNTDAFNFTDALLGEGVRYETAGSLYGGRKIWLLAILPEKYKLLDDQIFPYICFTNSHDASGAVKVAVTATRVVCANTLSIALSDAQRIWSCNHVGSMDDKFTDAKRTLLLAENYMEKLVMESERLAMKKLPDAKVVEIINELIAMPDGAGGITVKNIERLREEMKIRYFDAPDLQYVPKSSYRLLNAVADFCDHSKPRRLTDSYQENLFSRTIDGNPLLLKAQQITNAL